MSASTSRKNDSLVWTDDEVELLLRVSLDYKTARYQENIDWETCQNKYRDITVAFQQQYNTGDAAAAGKDFPHEPSNITKTPITAKLKAVRNKYRHAVDSGRRSGHGRVILLFYDLCHEIWGGSPAAPTIPSGFESGDLVEETSTASPQSSTDRPASPAPTQDSDAEIGRRRNLLQDKRNNHRTNRLKRKAPAEERAEEDIRIRRRMLELMESSEMHVRETKERLNANIERLSHTLEAGFDMVKTLFQQQQVLAPHTYAPHAPHRTTPHQHHMHRTSSHQHPMLLPTWPATHLHTPHLTSTRVHAPL
ncbi:uncharacterized protein PAE49_020877 [Odontesthes bonariensis]|uniref:uncharacterized protein LOC142369427 n=1 Tax=Odontesthes bonariensis TaxID=219752 RepID=UPI003F58FE06